MFAGKNAFVLCLGYLRIPPRAAMVAVSTFLIFVHKRHWLERQRDLTEYYREQVRSASHFSLPVNWGLIGL